MELIDGPEKRANYAWTEWADGNWRKAVGGVDFTSTASSFGQSCRNWCKKNGYRAELLTTGAASKTGTVQFRIYHDELETVLEAAVAELADSQPGFPNAESARAAAREVIARIRQPPAAGPVPPDPA